MVIFHPYIIINNSIRFDFELKVELDISNSIRFDFRLGQCDFKNRIRYK